MKSIQRICKTLFKEIDLNNSSIELLVDYIIIKLKKEDPKAKWDELGYDISDFKLCVRKS